MQEVKKRPFLRFAVLCEKVEQGRGGLVTLVNIFDTTTVGVTILGTELPPKLPPAPFQCTLAMSWTAGFGHFNTHFELVAPSGRRAEAPEQVFWLPAPTRSHNFFVDLNIAIEEEGVYRINIYLDGEQTGELIWPVKFEKRLVSPPER